uniref:Uncharacterized protein n=1 Tax=Arundo donax TaxID=35708 RepID=A0A0A9B753_ARUDO
MYCPLFARCQIYGAASFHNIWPLTNHSYSSCIFFPFVPIILN